MAKLICAHLHGVCLPGPGLPVPAGQAAKPIQPILPRRNGPGAVDVRTRKGNGELLLSKAGAAGRGMGSGVERSMRSRKRT